MKNVKWTDNICTVGGTCIHGYFTPSDLAQLFALCDDRDASFTPTFYHERLGAYGFGINDLEKLRLILEEENKKCQYFSMERGYYFTFMEKDGQKLLSWLKERFPMVRKEPCF